MQKLQSLKNKILTLAIQGKLVPQEETDEPASVLVQKIQQEKEQLIQEKKLKKDTVISSVIYKRDDKYFEKIGDIEKDITKEIPFEIPKNWQWVRLGILLKKIGSGSTPKGGREIYSANGIKFIRSQNVHNSGLQLKDIVYISDEINNQKTNSVVLANDVLLNITGASIGRCAVVPSDFDLANINQHVMILRLFSVDVRFWIHLVIISDFIQSLIMSVQNGSSKEALTINKINQFLIPLPPFEEQKRIVKKVQELFAQIDCIEKNNQELDNLKAAFKNKMLSLAIQGKLVPQTETDEPASILLEKIQQEREKITGKKSTSSTIYKKDDKYFEKIGNKEKEITKEIPFEIPSSWEWVRLGNIFNVIRGSSPRPKGSSLYWSNTPTKYPWITIKDISNYTKNGILYNTAEYLTYEGTKLSTYVEKGELIVAVSGSVGKNCILGINGYIYDGLSAVINFSKKINTDYLELFFKWEFNFLKSQITGSVFPNINTEILKRMIFPLPPLEEQHRIVKRLEEIFTLCDKL